MESTTEIVVDREALARWYAKRHMDADTGISKIFYLPETAPGREIRFVELCPVITEVTELEAKESAADRGRADGFRVFTCTITPFQWESVLAGGLKLPGEWSLAGAQLLASKE